MVDGIDGRERLAAKSDKVPRRARPRPQPLTQGSFKRSNSIMHTSLHAEASTATGARVVWYMPIQSVRSSPISSVGGLLVIENIEALERRLWSCGQPPRELQLRQQRVLHARHGPDLPAPRLQPLLTVKEEIEATCRVARRQDARADEGGLLRARRDLPPAGGPLRLPRRAARQRGPAQASSPRWRAIEERLRRR